MSRDLSSMDTVRSENDVSILQPDERWLHIIESHSEMAGYYADVLETLEDPDEIYEGESGELLATRKTQIDKYIIVVYKEVKEEDGFVITAFLTKRKKQVEKISALVPHLLGIPRKKIWVDYDEEADVLYVSFKKPGHADDSQITDDDIIIRYKKRSDYRNDLLKCRQKAQRKAHQPIAQSPYNKLHPAK